MPGEMKTKDFRLVRSLPYQRRSSNMKKTLLILAVALMTLGPISSSAAVRGFVGVGPGWGGYYGPYWGAYSYGPYGYFGPMAGEVKLDTKVKDAQVFINDAYAGTTKENRTMHLRPGNYKIEIREAGRTPFSENVFVAAGKTLHLHPEL
jgi:hypothetical protein